MEYSVLANFSESKSLAVAEENTLFGTGVKSKNDQSENEFLIPEHKQLNYFFVIRGEMDDDEIEDMIQQIRGIDIVLTAIRIDPKTLRSKQNLIF
jgi:hypothetical protein